MKIGIITIIDSTNYGNRLQNYAVTKILQNYGCEVMTLDLHNEKPYVNRKYILWLKIQMLRFICNFPRIAEKRFGNEITRWANFVKWNSLIPIKKLYNMGSLPRYLNNKYDFFFAGSDQIWNYNFASKKFNDYFLQFAEKRKRVAICASFGVDKIPDNWKKEYQERLNGFTFISVREESGQTLVKELIGKEVPVLIDPTMMLDRNDWLKTAKTPRVDCSRPYILKYYLGDKTDDKKIDIWAHNNGFKIYELLNSNIPELYSAGPGEFISLINNASMICSDSFHCIVFSIIFNKPFIAYARQGRGNNMSSRFDTLLKKFGFENRWNYLLSEDQYLECDYTFACTVLKREKDYFNRYISKVLNGKKSGKI